MAEKLPKKEITFKELAIDPQHQEAFKKITDLIRLREYVDEEGNKHPVNTKFGITDRALGKTKNSSILMLYMVAIDDDYQAGLLGRDWNENTTQSRPYYEDLLQEFVHEIWQDETVKFKDNRQAEWRDNWHLDWRSLYRGIVYQNKERIKFLDLYNPSQAKRRINNPLTDLIFDEFIPSRDMREQGKGYQINEVKRYSDIEKSCRRNSPNINKVFLGNPNDPYWNIPYLTDFEAENEKLEKWYWENRPNDPEEYRKWSWIKWLWNDKGQVLYLEKTVGDIYEFGSYEEFNWDLYFAKREDLGVVKWADGWRITYTFNSLACFWDPIDGIEVMVELNWLEKNKPQEFKEAQEIQDYVVDNYTFIMSKKPNWLKAMLDKEIFQEELKWKLTENKIKFLDLESRRKIEEFIVNGKTKRESKDIYAQ
ncbi:hypothetical protein [endosymbiont GvMRE of Glomus versiforme]|uniref:hypothetical protein n=1 Tax=endosymbiont GvMRE of Glomus versiforme TaxID=2039283 RepID=UPI000EE1E944|nr:hypothetical protein [endosymbiont GvMRE of Glomus versiforme]RHZ37751.1 hypothetical protein GvMRE_I1g534 [endosymbiont GvMRE of Glomus versiforme]